VVDDTDFNNERQIVLVVVVVVVVVVIWGRAAATLCCHIKNTKAPLSVPLLMPLEFRHAPNLALADFKASSP